MSYTSFQSSACMILGISSIREAMQNCRLTPLCNLLHTTIPVRRVGGVEAFVYIGLGNKPSPRHGIIPDLFFNSPILPLRPGHASHLAVRHVSEGFL